MGSGGLVEIRKRPAWDSPFEERQTTLARMDWVKYYGEIVDGTIRHFGQLITRRCAHIMYLVCGYMGACKSAFSIVRAA
jgi:hypothetical protein